MDNLANETSAFSANYFEDLVAHLVEVEENRIKLLDEFFPQSSRERQDMDKLITDYINAIEKLINSTNKVNKNTDLIPFVIVGSQVKVCNLDTDKQHTFKIISPLQGKKSGHVSFLSPIGKSLLLKKVGDIVQVHAPGGMFRYEILSVSWEQP